MDRIQKYIINNLSVLFLSIFLPLFAIASVIFLIKLATYTAVIQLSVLEMAKLYIFILPEVLFFTLPISFFIAAALTLFRLSTDNEIVVLFALGIHPKVIIKTLLKPALLLSILLIFDFFVVFPHTKTLSKNFISYKKSEAKFNLSASEFGHSFGDWLLYVGKNNSDDTFADVFLFNKNQENEEILIGAKKAQVINDSGILRLKLTKGQGYSYSNKKFSQIDFKTMYINDTMNTNLKAYQNAIEYWKDDDINHYKREKLITYMLISIFPILNLFLIASIGIVHIRHQKGKIYLFLFLGIVLYYGVALGLQKALIFYTVPTVFVVWLASTYMLYRKTIVSRF